MAKNYRDDVEFIYVLCVTDTQTICLAKEKTIPTLKEEASIHEKGTKEIREHRGFDEVKKFTPEVFSKALKVNTIEVANKRIKNAKMSLGTE